jgi:hypothetical protein
MDLLISILDRKCGAAQQMPIQVEQMSLSCLLKPSIFRRQARHSDTHPN